MADQKLNQEWMEIWRSCPPEMRLELLNRMKDYQDSIAEESDEKDSGDQHPTGLDSLH